LIVIDTNILVDVFARDRVWEDRSLAAIEFAAARERLVINDIVYAELSPGFATMSDLDGALARTPVTRVAIPKLALYLAGQAYRHYRRQRGTKNNVLPDFVIGAHAAVEGAQLLTRDARRIKAYFPMVEVISP
jgi:predicted nucleic acid-binding protein